MVRKSCILLFLSGCIASLHAQEVVTGLLTDIRVKNAWEKSDMRKGLQLSDTLELPFSDDFSGYRTYPDENKWQDKYVLINNSYSVRQRSCGIATFDALDQTGRLYESATFTGFEADRLTSQPINLEYPPSDSIYLSFFYEPGGIADMPEDKDSLVLQFFAPGNNEWYSVWKAPEIAADTFKSVMIRIEDLRYLKKGFMFRFINYASTSANTSDPSMIGNCDQWNLDYIFLDRNRNFADSIPADVAFTLPVRSLLNSHESIPWKQFREIIFSEMGDWIKINYMNNDMIVRNVTRRFEIFDVYKNTLATPVFSAGAVNMDPFERTSYDADLLYTFGSDNDDSALFRIKCFLTTDVFDPKDNDTILYFQRFSNYFSFDDGTAESGYGINGLGSNHARVAYRFKTFVEDTLRAVQICFNDSYQNANQRSFDLMVWENDNGIPGNVLYTQEEMMVTQGSSVNGFYMYRLTDPVAINGEFFVGWRQRSETFLNAGFDLNTYHNGRQLYWLNGYWSISQQNGSLMIRPVFGKAPSSTGIEDLKKDRKNLRIWPNPAGQMIHIGVSDQAAKDDPAVRIVDLNGRELLRTVYRESLDISSLSPGVYIVILYESNRQVSVARLIISH